VVFGLGFVEIISLPCKGVLRGVFLANLDTDNLTSNNQRDRTHIKANVNTKSGPNKQQNTHSNKSTLKRQESAWFSRLLRHPARKWSGSILSTTEPARGLCSVLSLSLTI